MKICIVYGWAEGKWHGKILRSALCQAGYEITNYPLKADIIITHSGGCYMLPNKLRARLIIIVGLPYWPGKTLFQSTQEKVKSELKNLRWCQKTIFNAYYLVTQLPYFLDMKRQAAKLSLPLYQQATVIVLCNQSDPYANPEAISQLAHQRNWKFEVLPGQHDDLWLNPEIYIGYLRKYYH